MTQLKRVVDPFGEVNVYPAPGGKVRVSNRSKRQSLQFPDVPLTLAPQASWETKSLHGTSHSRTNCWNTRSTPALLIFADGRCPKSCFQGITL